MYNLIQYVIVYLMNTLLEQLLQAEVTDAAAPEQYVAAASVDHALSSPFEREQEARRLLERGIMPSVGNGFSFVIDRRPAGSEDDYISARDYTRYFSNWQIPIADADHRLRDHDIAHVASYQTMFAIRAFANLVQAAAQNSLSDEDLCHRFTAAMDGFGDAMRNLDFERSRGPIYKDNTNAARLQLERLIALLPPDPNRTPTATGSDDPLFTSIWRSLSLDYFERSAVMRPMEVEYYYTPESSYPAYEIEVPYQF